MGGKTSPSAALELWNIGQVILKEIEPLHSFKKKSNFTSSLFNSNQYLLHNMAAQTCFSFFPFVEYEIIFE